MLIAKSEAIDWLFHDSGITRYQISKDTEIPESTLSRIATGVTDMSSVRFGIAGILTAYAEEKQAITEKMDSLKYAHGTERLVVPPTIHTTLEDN